MKRLVFFLSLILLTSPLFSQSLSDNDESVSFLASTNIMTHTGEYAPYFGGGVDFKGGTSKFKIGGRAEYQFNAFNTSDQLFLVKPYFQININRYAAVQITPGMMIGLANPATKYQVASTVGFQYRMMRDRNLVLNMDMTYLAHYPKRGILPFIRLAYEFKSIDPNPNL